MPFETDFPPLGFWQMDGWLLQDINSPFVELNLVSGLLSFSLIDRIPSSQ